MATDRAIPESTLRRDEIPAAVREAVTRAEVVDLHTHLYDGRFENLILRGIDALLTYHYLISEALRASGAPADDFYAMGLEKQAEFVWDELFVRRSPVSEATRGIITAASSYGVDVRNEGLDGLRAFAAGMSAGEHIDRTFKAARVSHVVMTNDPFDDDERGVWLETTERDPRFLAGLRIDHLIMHLGTSHKKLQEWGYDINADFSGRSAGEARRFLADWIEKTDARYAATSFPPEFTWPDESVAGRVMRDAVIPACREAGIPFALMIGVNRRVNPALRKAGDTLGRADVSAVGRLCAEYGDVKFLCTMLSRENQHELAVTARKFSNLGVFGCWWFVNTPSMVAEITSERLELLGLSFVPQHSDARVLDQLVYKWAHARKVIGDCLVEKYLDLYDAGWEPALDEIIRDVEMLFSGHAKSWLRLDAP